MLKPKLNNIVILALFLLLLISNAGCSPGVPPEGNLQVHFIDVGQGDSILIKSPQAAVLIDGGPNSKGEHVVRYIKNQGITELDAVIGTHPHEDHIGGLDTVLNSIPVTAVYIPSVTHTTNTFADFITAVKNSGAKRIQAQAGVKVEIRDIKGEFLGPLDSYGGDLNNNSAVFKLIYGDTAFLFTGDAEAQAETDLVENGYLHADVLKVAHHGSSTSTTGEFLEAVAPTYAIISCGKDNSYGHPHIETINRLVDADVQIYRTDESGTIIFESDGTELKLSAVR